MLFPSVDAASPASESNGVKMKGASDIKSESKTEDDELSESDEDSVDETEAQGKKKPRREKIGFRDRKVGETLGQWSEES